MDPILANQIDPVNWTLLKKGIHYMAYKIYIKQPSDSSWTELVSGTSEDGIVDSGSFKAVTGTQFYYSFGIGHEDPSANFDVSFVLTQNHVTLENGIINKKGKLDSNGVASRKDTLIFQ